jgi:hypothetical protein
MGGPTRVSTMQQRPLRSSLLLLLLGLALAACGGGGGSSGLAGAPAPTALAITTQSLPGGSVGTPIDCPPLEVVNAQGTPVWDLASGALPGGLALEARGTISGTPTSDGSFSFVVRVRDDNATDTQALSISIGAIDLSASGGLVFGNAWTGQAVSLSTNGSTGGVAFSIVANDSGGALSAVDPVAGTATWTPGVTGGLFVQDTIRATDVATGNSADLDLDVMQDPTEQYTASFGSSDVWWIDDQQKFGSHAFASDMHKALADIGLRNPTSTGSTGTEADQLAALWFRVELLRQVNGLFLRNADGSPGDQGLAITFPFEEPGAGYLKPAAGSVISGSPVRYSQLGVTTGTLSGVIGTAFLDGATNSRHENDTNDADDELGVFPNQITPIFNSSFGQPLSGTPVGAADLPALRALLYGLPDPGGRYATIRYVGRGYARTLAAVVAHEVGHSLGLDHTSPSQPNSIMNPSASIGPAAVYAFTAADITRMQNALPGAGKSGGGLSALTVGDGMPEGGVVVCHCRAEAAHR